MSVLCLRQRFTSTFLTGFYRHSSASTAIEQAASQPDDVSFEENLHQKEGDIEKKRNISRLTAAHYNLVNGRRPYEIPKCLAHETVKYNRKLYGKYGISSGVNPSLCWPSQKDIEDSKEYESVAYPFTIQEMMAQVAKKRKEEKERIENRENEVAVKFAKLQQWKKELNDKIAKKTAEATAAKQKKERLVEEVRRYFGFKLDPQDERFQEMLTKREKEQKKMEKQAKKEAREKMMIAKLQQKSVEISNN